MRKNLTRTLALISLGIGLVELTGCGLAATRPVQELNNAEAALRAAKDLNADSLVPALYRSSADYFAKAKREYRLKNFEKAKMLFIRSMKLAEQAEFEAYGLGGAVPEVASKLITPEGASPDAESSFKDAPNEPTLPPEQPKPDAAPSGSTGPRSIGLLAQYSVPQTGSVPGDGASAPPVTSYAPPSTGAGVADTAVRDIKAPPTQPPYTADELDEVYREPPYVPQRGAPPAIESGELRQLLTDEAGNTKGVESIGSKPIQEGLAPVAEVSPKPVEEIQGELNEDRAAETEVLPVETPNPKNKISKAKPKEGKTK